MSIYVHLLINLFSVIIKAPALKIFICNKTTTNTTTTHKLRFFFSPDVFTLREDHRIIGSLSGCLPRAPRQDNFLGVPLLLSLYEVDLLVSKHVHIVVSSLWLMIS